MAEFHTDKYAIENIMPDGTRVRVMEMFGENAAKLTTKQFNAYWETQKDTRPGRHTECVRIQ